MSVSKICTYICIIGVLYIVYPCYVYIYIYKTYVYICVYA